MPEEFVMGLDGSVTLSRIHCSLYKIANPLLAVVYANMATIVTSNILYNCHISCMRLIIYQAETRID
ncbi:hypothetical protein ENTCAN_06193 [Enterobacter cancerogenus ATCC 35316]|nr:hypothetical protein ENTCAN_06193 [Enterobacter cancerogenus ATCC 35316]